MLLAPCSANLSAQSPPCSRKASPLATRPNAFFRLRASPAKTSGGNVASCASTSASAFVSVYTGCGRFASSNSTSDDKPLRGQPNSHLLRAMAIQTEGNQVAGAALDDV